MRELQSARILDQLRERFRYLHYSLRTEEAYVYWAKAFIRLHKLRHPAELGKLEIEAYLMWPAAKHHVSSSTHPQASKSAVRSFNIAIATLQDLTADSHTNRRNINISPAPSKVVHGYSHRHRR